MSDPRMELAESIIGLMTNVINGIVVAIERGEDWEPLADQLPTVLKAKVAQELQREGVLEELRKIREEHT